MLNDLWSKARVLTDNELDVPCDVCRKTDHKRRTGSLERIEDDRITGIENWVLCEDCYSAGWQKWEVYSHEIIEHGSGVISFPVGEYSLLYRNLSGQPLLVY